MLADKLYATYIEWKVPSLYYMLITYLMSTDSNGLAYKITEGQGFLSVTTSYTLRARGIYETIVENAYSFL